MNSRVLELMQQAGVECTEESAQQFTNLIIEDVCAILYQMQFEVSGFVVQPPAAIQIQRLKDTFIINQEIK